MNVTLDGVQGFLTAAHGVIYNRMIDYDPSEDEEELHASTLTGIVFFKLSNGTRVPVGKILDSEVHLGENGCGVCQAAQSPGRRI